MKLIQARTTCFRPNGCNISIEMKLTEETFKKLKVAGLHELKYNTELETKCGDIYDFVISGELPRVDMGVLELIQRTTGHSVIVDFEADEITIYDGYIE